MIMTIDDTYTTETRSLEEVIESPTIVPRRIGSCSNPKGDGTLGSIQPCGAKIMSDDIEALDLPGEKHICGNCVDDLLRDKTASYSPLAR
jgi:hypothetical protein